VAAAGDDEYSPGTIRNMNSADSEANSRIDVNPCN
jgi:hypothetical protein